MDYTIFLTATGSTGTNEILSQIDKIKKDAANVKELVGSVNEDLANLEELVKLIKERETKLLGMHWVKGKD